MHSTERAGNQINRKNNQADVHQADQRKQGPDIDNLISFRCRNQRAENRQRQREHGNTRTHDGKCRAFFSKEKLHLIDAEDIVLLFGNHRAHLEQIDLNHGKPANMV